VAVLRPASRQTISLAHGHACCQGLGAGAAHRGFPRSQSAPTLPFSHAARCHTRTARSPTSSHQASLVFRPDMSAIRAPKCGHECRHRTSPAAAAGLGRVGSCLHRQGCVAAMTTTCMSTAGPERIGSRMRRQDRCELPHAYDKFHGIRAIAAQPMRVRRPTRRVSNSVISLGIRVAG
jgi:hypothetical protein